MCLTQALFPFASCYNATKPTTRQTVSVSLATGSGEAASSGRLRNICGMRISVMAFLYVSLPNICQDSAAYLFLSFITCDDCGTCRTRDSAFLAILLKPAPIGNPELQRVPGFSPESPVDPLNGLLQLLRIPSRYDSIIFNPF